MLSQREDEVTFMLQPFYDDAHPARFGLVPSALEMSLNACVSSKLLKSVVLAAKVAPLLTFQTPKEEV